MSDRRQRYRYQLQGEFDERWPHQAGVATLDARQVPGRCSDDNPGQIHGHRSRDDRAHRTHRPTPRWTSMARKACENDLRQSSGPGSQATPR
eukprot:355471-Chlamydomonas_euryale.AAC.11